MKRREEICRRFMSGLLLLVLVLGFCLPVHAAQKYIQCSRADMYLEMDSMGAIHVQENWDCFFGGDPITRYARHYHHPAPGLTEFYDFRVYLDGEELQQLPAPDADRPEGCVAIFDENDETTVELYLNAHNESHIITIEYCMSSAVVLYEDVAEFHWDFTSTKEAFDIDVLEATIQLPQPVESRGLSFWGHGPRENSSFIAEEADGNVDTFRLHTESIAKDKNVSVRFAMPLELFPEGQRFGEGEVYNKILEEEHALQDHSPSLTEPEETWTEAPVTEETEPVETLEPETEPVLPVETEPYVPYEPEEESLWDWLDNLQFEISYWFTNLMYNLGDFLRNIGIAALVVLVPFLPRIFRTVTRRFRREQVNKKRIQTEQGPLYYRTLPDDMKPALVYKLLSVYPDEEEGARTLERGNPFSATLLDLIERDIIHMDRGADGQRRYFVTPKARQTNLTAYENRLVSLYTAMGAAAQPMTTREITQVMHSNRTACGNVYEDFLYSDLEPAFEQQGFIRFIEGAGEKVGLRIAVGLLTGILVFFWISSFEVIFAVLLGTAAGFAAKSLFQKVAQALKPASVVLTQKGEERYALWKAYEHFLNDFTTFEDKQVDDVRLWKKHLVYATAIGCSPKVVENLKAVLPQVFEAIREDFGMDAGEESVFSSIDHIQQECDRPYRRETTSSSSSFDGWSSDDRDWGEVSESDSDSDSDSGSSGSDFD